MRLRIEYLKSNNDPNEIAVVIWHRAKLLKEFRYNKIDLTLKEIIKMNIEFGEEFCRAYPEISRKDLFQAFSKVDPLMLDYYKEQFPRGGYRGGGRPKGSLSKIRTNKTERVNLAVTPEEKQAVIKFLKEYRRKDVKK